MLSDYFVHMVEYEAWANEKMFAYVTSGRAPDSVAGIFNHLIADMTPWIHLLTERPVPVVFDVSPSWSLEECHRFLTLTMEELKVFVDGLIDVDCERVIVSQGPNARRYENTVSEILTQILSHGQHHRGQIEWIVERETGEYLGTSYMPYVRLLRSGTGDQ